MTRKPTFDEILAMARLEVSSEERKKLQEEMERMTSFFGSLLEADVENVQPFEPAAVGMEHLREDKPCASLSQEEALKNAPWSWEGWFVIPKMNLGGRDEDSGHGHL